MMVIGAEATGLGSGLGSYPEQALSDAPTTPTKATPATREKIREREVWRGIKIRRILSLKPDMEQDINHNMSLLCSCSASGAASG